MRNPKFDREELWRLAKSGKTQKEIATAFGVSRAAISKAMKKLGIAVVKDAATKSAPKIVGRILNLSSQFVKINTDAHELLDLLMGWIRGEKWALDAMANQIRIVRVGQKEEKIRRVKFKDPKVMALQVMEVIRGQIDQQLEINRSLYGLEAFKSFREAFIKVLTRKDPEFRNELIKELQKGGLLPEDL